MSLYAILVHPDNAYDIAGFEDISIRSAEAAVAAINFTRSDEATYLLYGVEDKNGYDTPQILSQTELDAQYRYSSRMINHCITKVFRKE